MSGATTLHRSALAFHHEAVRKHVRSSLGEWLFTLWKTLELWQERSRQRRRLLELDERLLRDIGMSRADAERLGNRPFWKE